jgi:hypothetical protein
MPCITCPDCRGHGAVATEPDGRPTWCRSCGGWGLEREADDDDEAEPVLLFWPESIRWIASA